MNKAYLCVITKNEGRDLAEWLLYHLFLGFHKIIVYDNGSTDNTRDLIECCSQYGQIEYIHWPKPFSQISAYSDCLHRHKKECEWMAFFDVDEFLVLPKHKYLDAFLASIVHTGAIAINWRMFGSNNHKTITNQLVLKAFPRRAIENFSANRHIKSIVNTKFVSKVINPHFFRLKRKYWFSLDRYEYRDAEGNLITWIKPGKSIDCGGASIAVIHHYFTKSEEHYSKKLQRGNADKPIKRENTFEFNDKNEVFDDSILHIYKEEIVKIEEILNVK
jgi:glycosyltransferase involved in cell wall biosynthesis